MMFSDRCIWVINEETNKTCAIHIYKSMAETDNGQWAKLQ